MPTVTRNDPYPGYNFQVTINQISPAGEVVSGAFAEVSGLQNAIEPIKYRNGNEALTMRFIPGLVTPEIITLKRGVTGHVLFWNWIRSGMDGEVQRQDGSIILQDENQQEVMRWNFARAWASKYSVSALNAGENQILMETVEVRCEDLRLDD